MDYTKPYPGIPELIDDLQKQGLRMAVASNKYQAATGKLIDRYFPAGTFAAVHGQREEIPPKPDPTIVRNILTETGFTSADTCLLYTSSDFNVQTPFSSIRIDLQAAASALKLDPASPLQMNLVADIDLKEIMPLTPFRDDPAIRRCV